MPTKRKAKQRRPLHVYQASEEAIQADIKRKVTVGSGIWCYLQQIREDDVCVAMTGFTISEAALFRDGMRAMARQLQDIAAYGMTDGYSGTGRNLDEFYDASK